MEQLIIDKTVIEYEIKPSAQAKRVRITVFGDKIIVTKPRGASLKEVKDFVEAKKEWILNHLEDYKQSEASRLQKEFVDGESFSYLGRDYPLRTIALNESKLSIEFKANTIWAYIPDVLPEGMWPEKIKVALTGWYKSEARRFFTERLDYYSKLMSVKYERLRIKEQKTRWGSCSSKGNVNLNWRIIMTPPAVVDYLIIHELSHLKHMNHSKEFWQHVKSYMHDYEVHKKWLREHAKELLF